MLDVVNGSKKAYAEFGDALQPIKTEIELNGKVYVKESLSPAGIACVRKYGYDIYTWALRESIWQNSDHVISDAYKEKMKSYELVLDKGPTVTSDTVLTWQSNKGGE